jgi:hypothetical protein
MTLKSTPSPDTPTDAHVPINREDFELLKSTAVCFLNWRPDVNATAGGEADYFGADLFTGGNHHG